MGRSLYVEAQDAVKKELAVRFPGEEFFWINILSKDDEDEEEEPESLNGRGGENNNPSIPISIECNVISIDNNIIETWAMSTEDSMTIKLCLNEQNFLSLSYAFKILFLMAQYLEPCQTSSINN